MEDQTLSPTLAREPSKPKKRTRERRNLDANSIVVPLLLALDSMLVAVDVYSLARILSL